MCGRFALTAPASTITEIFQVDVLPEVLPRYNVAPSQSVAAVVQDGGLRQMRTFRWGLIPSWAKDAKIAYQTINARGETVDTKPAFRSAFKRRRCLILADGFYEWKRLSKTEKVPHLIQVTGGRPFAMAGLWERWVSPEGDEVFSASIVTTGPNALMAPIHDRMPVILDAASWDTWLDPDNHDVASLRELLVPFDAERMQERTVSSEVNNARHEGPSVQEPFAVVP
jgi:putative SOS response-associated peptidase YedK